MPTRTTKPRRRPPDEVLWLIAALSILAPMLGVISALIGFTMFAKGAEGSGWWLATGAALIVFDYLTDIWLARVTRGSCEEPKLNNRAAKCIGRRVVLETPILAGRGRVKLLDGWWSIEGPDTPAGTTVVVTAAIGSVLQVEPAGD